MTFRWFLALGLLMGCDNGTDAPAGDDGEQATTSDDDDDGEDDDEDDAEDDDGPPTTDNDSSSTTADGESSSGGDEDAESSSGSTGDPPEAPTFDAVWEAVIAGRGCNNGYCHGSGDAGLWLTDVDSGYEALIDAPATDGACGQSTLVVPGDAAASALMSRVDPAGGPAGCDRMPLNDAALSPENAELVRAWIDGGALR